MSERGARFARLEPETVEVVETYRCRQEISRRPSLEVLAGEARGEIRAVVPLEDAAAREDGGEPERSSTPPTVAEADRQIGHLLLADFDRTDLDRVLPEASRFGAVPLRVPHPPDRPPGSGRSAAELAVEYTPRLPEVPPLDVRMELLDADAADGSWIDLDARNAASDADRVKRLMERRLGRGRGLLLKVEARIALPRKLVMDEAAQAERTVAARATVDLRWPMVPAPGTVLRLEVEPSRGGGEEKASWVEVSYDPVDRSLRWTDITLDREANQGRLQGDDRGMTDVDFVFYTSGSRFLLIERGEDLAGEPELQVRVEAEVSNLLLSGLGVRSFGADGRLRTPHGVACTTRVEADVAFILDDAIRTWRRSPVQRLRFEQVILDKMRVQDVQTVLQDLGFDVAETELADGTRLVRGRRPEGAAVLCLWVYLEGRLSSAHRRTELAGGQTYTTKVKSGDLEATMLGQLKADPGPVLDAMHSLHERLRHQFLNATDRR